MRANHTSCIVSNITQDNQWSPHTGCARQGGEVDSISRDSRTISPWSSHSHHVRTAWPMHGAIDSVTLAVPRVLCHRERAHGVPLRSQTGTVNQGYDASAASHMADDTVDAYCMKWNVRYEPRSQSLPQGISTGDRSSEATHM